MPGGGSSETRNPKPETRHPVCVAIEILDEDHSLRLAMRRLATDADLRASLGRAGQPYWQREHSLDAMVEDYERVMRGVRQAREGREMADVPTGEEKLTSLLAPFGVQRPW